MEHSTAQRRLVRSPPELWAQVSDEDALGRHLAEFGEIRITRVEPETTVAWEGDRASGTVELTPTGWGTRVTLTATPVRRASPAAGTVSRVTGRAAAAAPSREVARLVRAPARPPRRPAPAPGPAPTRPDRDAGTGTVRAAGRRARPAPHDRDPQRGPRRPRRRPPAAARTRLTSHRGQSLASGTSCPRRGARRTPHYPSSRDVQAPEGSRDVREEARSAAGAARGDRADEARGGAQAARPRPPERA